MAFRTSQKNIDTFISSLGNMAKSQETKAPSMKDLMLLGMMEKQGMLPKGSVASYMSPGDSEIRQIGGMSQQQPNVNVPFTPSVEATVGIKEDPNAIAQRDIQKKQVEQGVLLPGTLKEKKAVAEVENEIDVSTGLQNSEHNFTMISQSITPLVNTLVEAYKEGGAGNYFKKLKTQAAQSGLLGEKAQESLDDSTAYSGKVTEVILKQMPTLTQQLGKEGSTRIIQGVFEKLEKSYPGLQNAPKNARKMILNTLDSNFSVLKAVNILDKQGTFEVLGKNPSKEQSENLANMIANIASGIERTPEEEEAYTALKAEILKPLDTYISERDSDKSNLVAELGFDPNEWEVV